MRILTGILFVAGGLWASMAWIFVITPIGIILPVYEFQAYDVIVSITGSVTSLVGYFVWVGWGWFAVKGRYLGVKRRGFWLISLAQHAAWLPVLAFMRKETVVEMLGDEKAAIFTVWIITNILIATFCLILPLRNEQPIQSPQTTATSGRF